MNILVRGCSQPQIGFSPPLPPARLGEGGHAIGPLDSVSAIMAAPPRAPTSYLSSGPSLPTRKRRRTKSECGSMPASLGLSCKSSSHKLLIGHGRASTWDVRQRLMHGPF